jgi:NADPH-dependent 2,4-dienoyl-CoA reductase/sulfur reductase-like enzyme/rhodanese-related sulfurtransferase
MQISDIVVIGGVAAGPKTAATLMRRLPDATVTLFQKDELLSYSSCGLPYFASGDVGSFSELTQTSYGVPRDPAFFKNSRRFDAVTGAEVTRIDRDRKRVTVRLIATGETLEHGYKKLVIATGASPLSPPFPVAESDLIRAFYVPDDAIAFRRLAEQGKIDSAAIVGAGFVGCEMAEAIGSLWGIGTTVIEKEPQVLPGMLDCEMAALVEQELKQQGVTILTGATVERIDCDETGKPRVAVAGLASLMSDYVVLALGVRPEVTLARDCGLAIGTTGGISVNAGMQTSDPDIFAGGDCVESIHQITGQPLNICMGSLANRHGRVIAENLAGGDVTFPGALGTQLLRVFDMNAGAAGLTETAARSAGYSATAVWASFADKPDYQPEAKTLVVKMVYDRKSTRLLGLQAVGHGDICRRIDVFASFLQRKATVADLLDFEHGYAPPYSEALDPLHHLAGMAQAQVRGIRFLSPDFNFKHELSRQATVLDVREDEEAANTPLPSPITASEARNLHIPLDQLLCRFNEIERDGRIVIVCQRGARSYQAAMALKSKSFDNIEILGGGLQAVAY